MQNLAKSRLRNWTVIPHSTRAAENSRGTYVRCELKLTHNVSAQPRTLGHCAYADGQCRVSLPAQNGRFLYGPFLPGSALFARKTVSAAQAMARSSAVSR